MKLKQGKIKSTEVRSASEELHDHIVLHAFSEAVFVIPDLGFVHHVVMLCFLQDVLSAQKRIGGRLSIPPDCLHPALQPEGVAIGLFVQESVFPVSQSELKVCYVFPFGSSSSSLAVIVGFMML